MDHYAKAKARRFLGRMICDPRSMIRGFTVIELTMVLAMFAIISAVVLFNMKGFSRNVSLSNLAQDIALLIRSVQVEAVSGKIVSGAPVDFTPSYGVHFVDGTDTFVHFADLNNDKIYDDSSTPPCGDAGAECLETITLEEGYRVVDLCASPLDGPASAETCAIHEVSLTFTRPFQEPSVVSADDGTTYSNLYVKVLSPTGETVTVHLWPTGQVEVE